MANTILLRDFLYQDVMEKKKRQTVISQVANRDYEGTLKRQGQTVTVPITPRVRGNVVAGGSGAAARSGAGEVIGLQDLSVASADITVTEVYNSGVKVKDIEKVQTNFSLMDEISTAFSESSALNEDLYVASFFKDAASQNKANDKSPATLTTSNTYEQASEIRKLLKKSNAYGNQICFINPEIEDFMLREGIMNSSDAGLKIRLNGEVGRAAGMRMVVTNNLPRVNLLTVAANPSNSDTITVVGLLPDSTNTTTYGKYAANSVVFTLVTAGTASSAGDISLGATAADTQANIVAAINGTGTPGASTYIDISADDRKSLRNAMVSIDSFASNTANLRSSGDYFGNALAHAVSFSSGSNTLGSSAVLMTAIDGMCINLVNQFDKFKIEDQTGGMFDNILTEKVYGGAVLGENSFGIATAEVIV